MASIMPYKNIEKRKEKAREYYQKNISKQRKYYLENREKILEKKKMYGIKNQQKRKLYVKKLKEDRPWRSSYFNAKNRCVNRQGQNYKTYGGRGIRFLLSEEEIKILWFRDKAYTMKRHSLDRIDNNGNYEFSNCRFIEMSLNATKGNLEARWK